MVNFYEANLVMTVPRAPARKRIMVLHLFSEVKREGDLEDFLVKIGLEKGYGVDIRYQLGSSNFKDKII